MIKYMIRDVGASAAYALHATKIIARSRFTVVTFHRVLTDEQLGEYPLKNLAITIKEFDWFLSFFTNEYTCGSLKSISKRFGSGERPKKPFLAITFDDGQQDNYQNAAPVLDKYDVKATFFVTLNGIEDGSNLWHDNVAYSVTSIAKSDPATLRQILSNYELHIDVESNDLSSLVVSQVKHFSDQKRLEFERRLIEINRSPLHPEWDGLMNWDQIQSLSHNGHEIGSHTFSHPILNNCDDEKLHYEIAQSRFALEDRLNTTVNAFCYPNGDFDDRVLQIVRNAGYRQAVTTKWGLNGLATDPLTLNRCDIQTNTSVSRHGSLSRARLAMRLSGLQPGIS